VQLEFRAARMRELPFVFKLIQSMAREQVVNPAYLRLPYNIALANQLLGAIALHRLVLPDGVAYKAHLRVALLTSRPIGFWLERETAPRSFERHRELYLMGVAQTYRGSGLGGRMLDALIAGLPAQCAVVTDCVGRASAMRSILKSRGFRERDATPRPGHYEPVSRFQFCAGQEAKRPAGAGLFPSS